MKTRAIKNLATSMATATALTMGIFASAQADESGRYLVRYDLGNKTDVVAALSADAVIHHEFDRTGLMAISMSDSDLQSVANLGVIRGISEDPIYNLFAQDIPYGIDMVEARDTWDADRDNVVDANAATGEGIRVCIVDTGIYAAHEDLGAGGVNILAGKSWTGEMWDEDRQGHGTHVAGTIAAMNNDAGVVGVSPGTVDLLIADVFSDAGEGQNSSTIFAAVEWCADNGANIISMSLGGPLGAPIDIPGVTELPFDPDFGLSYANEYREIYDRGILIIAAAGNDGDARFNFPGSYPSVVSVAALDSTETKAEFSNFNVQVEVSGPGVSVLSTYPFENSMTVDGGPTYKANAVAFSSVGDLAGSFYGPLADGGTCNEAVPAGTYDGNVVLCRRGDAAFQVKIDNAGNAGASGVIIMNNVPGNVSATYGDPEETGLTSTTPAISISQADGDDALTHVGTGGTMVVNLESIQGYAEVSGTSMATPHVSGVAAVQWGACTDLTHDQVRSHLTGTTRSAASDATGDTRDIEYGYGLVQTKAGVDALRDGIDTYTANPDGNNPANVECYMPIDPTDPTDPAEDGSKAQGGGWVAANGNNKDKINFNFEAHDRKENGLKGKFKLKHKAADVSIDVSKIDSFTTLTADCGPVAAGSNAIQMTGDGYLNDLPASFRMCAADVDQKGKGNDLIYLECTSGCSYSTTAAGSDGVLGAGNVNVRMVASESSSDEDAAEASTMTLGPLLLDDTTAGAAQVLIAQVFNGTMNKLSGANVELTAVQADGTTQTLSAITGPTGEAVFTVVMPGESVEYRATSGTAETNTVATTPKN